MLIIELKNIGVHTKYQQIAAYFKLHLKRSTVVVLRQSHIGHLPFYRLYIILFKLIQHLFQDGERLLRILVNLLFYC